TSTTSSPAFGTRVSRGVCGLVLEEETADETIAHVYDPHGREERTDRRAHGEADFRTVAEFVYNAMGDMIERRTYTNETDYVTERFAYDHEGREIASTNALGNVVTTSYDPRGNVTAVDGATYPLRMEYDLQGRRTALTTFRDAGGAASSPPVGDTTRWTLDPATGLCLSKTYADNSTVSYTYTPDGLPARTTWPDGRWSELVYDDERNVAGMTRSDNTPGIFLSCDAYGETTNAMDTVGNAWRYVYGENSALLCETNVLAGGRLSSAAGQGNLFIPSICVMSRALDAQGRPAGYSFAVDGVAKGGIGYAYDDEGRIASVVATNSAGRVIVVSYLHGNGHVNGYEIRLPGGGAFGRSVVRDPYRRELVASCSSSFGGSVVDSYAYGYNSYGWPVARNGDSFAYNERGEVARAEIGGDVFTHEYDGIGNHTLWGDNAVTNEYAHNSLNQLTSSQRISVPSVAPCEMTYSSNGGLASDGTWLYAYDAEDRLVSVTSASLTNGALRVENAYDWRDRRISKTMSRYDSTDETWNVVERRVFTYDDWNLVHETIMQIGGAVPTATEVQYFWGLDLSETLQGAGGVGGLLAVSINGAFYIPCYDNNGNVTKYVGETGAV
ncbi:MAG: RHS repeat protein, partial [Kiritimatiellae bacterium]|nr:RHS repeat protein [Kiritimatiellia bacterium]